ncbi:hypothetical protein LAZ67_13000750 [Cordylochernes scorpioides]|uniref:Transposase n=1 Tax=Cordylochernes scorpioides TaxID=51811 RepID=A0ABY6L5R4_9ARAC|nr:hypothetical protein LAZ67_13000750 [Cordylochernes scorpioides]
MMERQRVVFSDESRFFLSSNSRRVPVWRRRGERSNPAAIVERPTVRQRGIMVWGAIAYDSRSPLLRIQGTMTAQRYVDDVLRQVTLPYLQGVPNALYQQDKARPHTARISQQALQDVQMLPWPPYSPDLSPIEHVWDIIGRRLHALPQPRSEHELWQMREPSSVVTKVLLIHHVDQLNFVFVKIKDVIHINLDVALDHLYNIIRGSHDEENQSGETFHKQGMYIRGRNPTTPLPSLVPPLPARTFPVTLGRSVAVWQPFAMELPISSPAKCELRSVIRFLNAKNNSPVEIHRQLVEVYGEKCMDIKNVRKWCREFNEGRINVHDEQRSGRPSLPESTVARIDEMVRANRRITLEEIEDGLNEDCSHFSVHKIVSETLGYRKVSTRKPPAYRYSNYNS